MCEWMWVDEGLLFVVQVFCWGVRPPSGGLGGRLFEALVVLYWGGVGEVVGMGYGC